MNTFSAKPEDIKKDWVLIDAEGIVLGRAGRAALSLEPRGLGAYASVNRGACPAGDADGRAQAVEQSEEVAVGAHGQRYLGGVRGRGQGQW